MDATNNGSTTIIILVFILKIIPLDTHIFKISKMFKLTNRNDAGMKTALEITENLKKYDKTDPIRFDFSLTRPGIHPDLDYSEFDQGSTKKK